MFNKGCGIPLSPIFSDRCEASKLSSIELKFGGRPTATLSCEFWVASPMALTVSEFEFPCVFTETWQFITGEKFVTFPMQFNGRYFRGWEENGRACSSVFISARHITRGLEHSLLCSK